MTVKTGMGVYLKAAPEISGTVGLVRDGRFTVHYTRAEFHRLTKVKRATFPLRDVERFGALADRPRIKQLAKRDSDPGTEFHSG